VDLVAGTRQFHHLPRMVEEVRERRDEPGRRLEDQRVAYTDMASEVAFDRAGEEWSGGMHAYLAVMRGCDLSCTYCVVPHTRGGVQSRPIADLVAEARWYAEQGVKVLTLLGQTVNSYGEDFPAPGAGEARGTGRQGRTGLGDLLRALQEVEGLERIRLITLHPSYATRALAEAIRDCDKVDRFLPLPAQAGSDPVLKRMKRGYTLDLYRRRADTLREVVPDLELGSDWIVGFCGETDEDFAGSQGFLEEQGFVVNYIFKYDERPGTKAVGYPDDIEVAVKKERHRLLMETAERVQRARFEGWRGRTERVFVESVSTRDASIVLGRSVHGLPVSLPGDASFVGTYRAVVLDECTAYGLSGRVAEAPAGA
jgi:tRNA-2-methylthio-N6-dimethylallyladenosine synthase